MNAAKSSTGPSIAQPLAGMIAGMVIGAFIGALVGTYPHVYPREGAAIGAAGGYWVGLNVNREITRIRTSTAAFLFLLLGVVSLLTVTVLNELHRGRAVPRNSPLDVALIVTGFGGVFVALALGVNAAAKNDRRKPMLIMTATVSITLFAAYCGPLLIKVLIRSLATAY